jgi:hypothetical protein
MSARLSVINFVDDATLSASPAAVSTLPVDNLTSPMRDRLWRASSLATQVISGHWSGAGRKPNCLGLFRHNGHGGQVRLQLYQDKDLTTQVYDSGVLDLFDVVALGSFDWGVDPLGLGPTDPYGGEAPYTLFFTATACAGFKVTLSGFGGSGSPYWQAGRLWLGKYFEFAYNAAQVSLRPVEASEQVRTRGASLRANRGGRWHEMDMDFAFITEDDRPVVLDSMKQAGLAQDVLFSVFPTGTGRNKRDYTINGHLASLEPITWIETRRTGRLTITEN